MKTVLAAGLAGFLLSGASTAQDDWTFIACEIESREVGPWVNGEQVQTRSRNVIYRFNASEIASFSRDHMAWYSQCETSDYVRSAHCSITPDRVRVSIVTLDTREEATINRLNGVYSKTLRYDENGSGTDYGGTCTLTDDPTAGRRAF